MASIPLSRDSMGWSIAEVRTTLLRGFNLIDIDYLQRDAGAAETSDPVITP